MKNGYKIIPVNPKAGEILREVCFPDLGSIPEPRDMVDIFQHTEEVPVIVEEAVARTKEAGLLVVMDKCMFKEHRKLRWTQ